MATAAWCDVHPSQLAGPGACFKEYDLLTVTLDELKAPLQARLGKSHYVKEWDRDGRMPKRRTCCCWRLAEHDGSSADHRDVRVGPE